jgi:hypothetical protein
VNDSGSAAIGVFSIVLQGRTHNMKHAHPIACHMASSHSPAESNDHRHASAAAHTCSCPADAQ